MHWPNGQLKFQDCLCQSSKRLLEKYSALVVPTKQEMQLLERWQRIFYSYLHVASRKVLQFLSIVTYDIAWLENWMHTLLTSHLIYSPLCPKYWWHFVTDDIEHGHHLQEVAWISFNIRRVPTAFRPYFHVGLSWPCVRVGVNSKKMITFALQIWCTLSGSPQHSGKDILPPLQLSQWQIVNH